MPKAKPITLLIVWHSRTGTAQQMASAAKQGALEAAQEMGHKNQIKVLSKPANETGPEDLLNANGYLFCAPENLASLSGAMKEFFDVNYYAVLDKLNGRPYALMISAGSDGQMALKQAERIAKGWRLEKIMPSIIINTNAQTAERIWEPKTINNEQTIKCKEAGAMLAGVLLLGM